MSVNVSALASASPAKNCKRCGERRSLEEFSTDRSKPDGLSNNCFACRREADKRGSGRAHRECALANRERRNAAYRKRHAELDAEAAARRIAAEAAVIPGFVYLIRHPSFKGWLKVGRSIDIFDRLQGHGSSMPSEYAGAWEIVGLWRCQDSVEAERVAVAAMVSVDSLTRDASRREWFKVARYKHAVASAHAAVARAVKYAGGIPA